MTGDPLDHGFDGFLLPDLGFGLSEQSSATRELGLAVTIGEQTVVANAHEAGWQDMQQESADELGDIKLHDLDRRSITIVAPAEPNLAVSKPRTRSLEIATLWV